MLIVNNIDGSPETNPSLGFGSHFDGKHFIFFESAKEAESYRGSLNAWSKESYSQEVNDAHSLLYQSLWQTRDYKDENEISLYADLVVDENTTERQLQWKEEAITLRNYYLLTTDILYNYFDTVTEETAISVEEFIQTLPIFNG